MGHLYVDLSIAMSLQHSNASTLCSDECIGTPCHDGAAADRATWCDQRNQLLKWHYLH